MSGPINQLSEKQKRLAMFLVSLTNNNLYKDGEILKRDFEGELTKIYGNDTADNIITKGGIRDTVIEFEFIDNKYYIYPDTYYKLHHFGRAKTQEIIDSFFSVDDDVKKELEKYVLTYPLEYRENQPLVLFVMGLSALGMLGSMYQGGKKQKRRRTNKNAIVKNKQKRRRNKSQKKRLSRKKR